MTRRDIAQSAHTTAMTAMMVIASTTLLSAHEQPGQAQGFLTGLRHPISGWDHVLAMIAVGLWGAQLGPPALWMLPVTFPMVMAIGGFLALVGIPVPGVEFGVALSALALGVMVALEAKPKLTIAAVIVGAFAIFHGHAHGAELPAGQSGLTYSIGFVVATGCLHLVGIAIGLMHKWPLGRKALRATGAAVAAAGITFVWRAFA